MSLAPGTRIGPYEVLGALGAGGMGEVYRARDGKLNRDVALKIMPPIFSSDPERQARFRREATVLASLNHPNIGHIYGFEDAAATHALVLELVEGPTIADRLGQGRLEVSETLSIARQIVDAMEAAHEAGVIHRDLKPANIKLRPDGTVKVLDFGLAKALDQAQGSGPRAQSDVSQSPTMTSPAQTALGIILGTAAYMSPEQARGRAIDKRADIWAFGCLLFEMLTGKAAFAGDNVTDTLAAVVRGEPEWAALPADTPPSIRRLLRRCLAKDVKHRLSDIGVARLEIDDASGSPSSSGETAPVMVGRDVHRPGLWLAAAFAVGVVVAGVAAWSLWPDPPAAQPVVRFALGWPEGQRWAGNNGSGVVITPDGTHVGYFAVAGSGPRQLHVRRLADDKTRVIPGSEEGYGPFPSPDSQQIGFIASGKLWRAPIADGAPFEIGAIDSADRGAVWSPDGFVYSAGLAGLSRIRHSGGARETLTTVDKMAGEISHRFPALVPGGHAVLFTIFKGSLDQARIAAVDLATRKVHVVMDLPGHSPHVTPTGHLLYLRSGVLMAVRFDAARVQVTGTPEPLMSGVAFNDGGAAHFAVSATGTLVIMPDSDAVTRSSVAWADRTRQLTPIDIPPDAYVEAAISPDGSQVALVRFDSRGKTAVVVWNFARKVMTTVTRELAYYRSPIWSPDGESIVFSYRPDIGSFGRMMRQRIDGSTAPTPVLAASAQQQFGSAGELPGSFHPDGRKLFYSQVATTSDGIWVLDLETGKTEQVLSERMAWPRISPDARWIAYSTAPLAPQLKLRPYPDPSRAQWIVGSPGSGLPRWSRDGSELFYLSQQGIFSVAVKSGPAPFDKPQLVVPSSGFRWYDVSPDGQRFIVLQSDRATQDIPHVVLNWHEELKKVR